MPYLRILSIRAGRVPARLRASQPVRVVSLHPTPWWAAGISGSINTRTLLGDWPTRSLIPRDRYGVVHREGSEGCPDSTFSPNAAPAARAHLIGLKHLRQAALAVRTGDG